MASRLRLHKWWSSSFLATKAGSNRQVLPGLLTGCMELLRDEVVLGVERSGVMMIEFQMQWHLGSYALGSRHGIPCVSFDGESGDLFNVTRDDIISSQVSIPRGRTTIPRSRPSGTSCPKERR